MLDYSYRLRDFDQARQRIRELQREAREDSRARLLPEVPSVRERLGLWLIAFGERLAGPASQGRRRQAPAG